jgi:hypothetical protein
VVAAVEAGDAFFVLAAANSLALDPDCMDLALLITSFPTFLILFVFLIFIFYFLFCFQNDYVF